MPFRRLPISDNTRTNALQTAKDKADATGKPGSGRTGISLADYFVVQRILKPILIKKLFPLFFIHKAHMEPSQKIKISEV